MRTSLLTRVLERLGPTVAVLVGLGFGIGRFTEVDTWWHLRVGEHILRTGELSGPDPWASFAARPYVATQWLPEAVAAWTVDHMGLGAIVLLRALGTVSLAVVLYAVCRLRAGRLTSGVVAATAVLGAGGGLNPRPQLTSFVLFGLVVFAWLRTVDDHRARWWLVPVFWVWACCHGLWTFGLAMGAIFLLSMVLDRRRRPDRRATARLLALLAACTVAVAATPLGPGLLGTPFTVAETATGLADEWRATPLNNIYSVVAVTMVVATLVLWLLAGERPKVWEAAALLTAVALILGMWRLVPLGCIVVAPLLASAVGSWNVRGREAWSRREGWAVTVGWLLAMVMAGTVALASPAGRANQLFPGDMSSIDIALARLPPKTVVLDDFAVSGWLLWQHPELTPVIDLRAEIYDADYIAMFRRTDEVRPGWRDLIHTTGARVAVLRSNSALALALRDRDEWREVAKTRQWVMLQSPAA